MSGFWSWYIIAIVAINIVGNAWLLFAMRRTPRDSVGEGESLGHEFDGIGELNNSLPRWWLWVFSASIVVGADLPGPLSGPGPLPRDAGLDLGQAVGGPGREGRRDLRADLRRVLPEVHPGAPERRRAVTIGARLFSINCSPCHGSDARGGKGFPNLTDGDWLHGGDPETIETTILGGRIGMMPAWGPTIGEDGVAQAANYVLSLSGRDHDPELAKKGETIFQTICLACHGLDGKGKKEMGSANLTDNTWLHGGSEETIRETIRNGRTNQMPAHKDLLGEEKVHLLALYVYSLSRS